MNKPNSKFYLAPLKLLTNFENPSTLSNPLQRPGSGDFDTGNAYMKLKRILRRVSVSIFKIGK
jgi:hypothetical protein